MGFVVQIGAGQPVGGEKSCKCPFCKVSVWTSDGCRNAGRYPNKVVDVLTTPTPPYAWFVVVMEGGCTGNAGAVFSEVNMGGHTVRGMKVPTGQRARKSFSGVAVSSLDCLDEKKKIVR